MLKINLTKEPPILYVAAAVISILLISLAFYLKNVSDYKWAFSNIIFQSIDGTKIADGTHTGECDVNFIYAKAEVTVQDGAITNIYILEHKNKRGQPAEAVIDKMLTEQKRLLMPYRKQPIQASF